VGVSVKYQTLTQYLHLFRFIVVHCDNYLILLDSITDVTLATSD
jgi:hypothetical protein